MTVPEKIEQIKIELAKTAGAKEQVQIIMDLLNKYAAILSADGTPYVEQLGALAEELDSDEYRGWTLCYRGMHDRLSNKPAEAVGHLKKALTIFEAAGFARGIYKATYEMGLAHFFMANYAEALENLALVRGIYEQAGNRQGLAGVYGNMGAAHEAQGNYGEALSNYLSALKIMQELGDESGEATVYHSLGNVCLYQGHYEEALKYYTTCLAGRERLGEKNGVASAHNNIGNLYQTQHNYTEARKSYSLAHALSEETGNQEGIAFAIGSIGIICLAEEDYTGALKNFADALVIFERIGDRMDIVMTYINLGKAYTGLKQQDEAIKYLKLAVDLGKAIGVKNILKSAYTAFSDTCRAFGLYQEALEYYILFHEMDKAILGEDTLKQITSLNFQHNIEQKEKDLEIEQLRNVELKKEKDRSEALLLNILPAEVAEELKDKGTAAARLFENVTVLFSDFKGFASISERFSPQALVDELHICFSAFDEICARHNVEKIKTVGDAYLAVSGLPLANPHHAEDMVRAAVEIRDFILRRGQETSGRKQEAFEVRIGIHSGHVVAGIVGVRKFAYDIWGDTVNTAARMEQNSEAGKINISETTYKLIQDKYKCDYRGEIEAKNKGKLKMYFVS